MGAQALKTTERLHDSFEQRAKEIMSAENVFGVGNAEEHFGVRAGNDMMFARQFSDTVLTDCKNTHLLVAIFPITLMDLMKQAGVSFGRIDCGREYLTKPCRPGYMLVRKTPVSESLGKPLYEQRPLLRGVDKRPSMAEMAYAVAGYELMTRERLFDDVAVLCTDKCGDGYTWYVGHRGGVRPITLGSAYDDAGHPDIGLASVRMSY